MRKAVILLLVVALLTVTNPGLDHFADWAVDSMVDAQTDEPIAEALGRAVARPLILGITERNHFGVFSLFTVSAVGVEKRYIGILRRFIALDDLELDTEELDP